MAPPLAPAKLVKPPVWQEVQFVLPVAAWPE
jgi:hypothetical protein